jgi:hypothetical protein
MAYRFVADNIVPVLAPVDIASTTTKTNYVDLKGALRMAFLVEFGLVTSASADTEVITIECATAEGGTEAAIAFNYRLSGAVGANTWGAITAATSSGLAIDPASDDGKFVWIEVNPDALAASDYRYARVVLTDTTDMTACLCSVVALFDSRYKQTTHMSATGSASS